VAAEVEVLRHTAESRIPAEVDIQPAVARIRKLVHTEAVQLVVVDTVPVAVDMVSALELDQELEWDTE